MRSVNRRWRSAGRPPCEREGVKRMTETEAVGLFKCLADKSRLQILKSLAQE